MKQENKHNVKIGETFYFKNRLNYEFHETIIRMTDKSVFTTRWNPDVVGRNSWNQFNLLIETILIKKL